MPSIVVTLEPAAWPASTVQDLTARPSIWTTQAPHWLVSQPTWVPVRFRFSRRRWTRRVLSSTSAETVLSLILSSTLDMPDLPVFLFHIFCKKVATTETRRSRQRRPKLSRLCRWNNERANEESHRLRASAAESFIQGSPALRRIDLPIPV